MLLFDFMKYYKGWSFYLLVVVFYYWLLEQSVCSTECTNPALLPVSLFGNICKKGLQSKILQFTGTLWTWTVWSCLSLETKEWDWWLLRFLTAQILELLKSFSFLQKCLFILNRRFSAKGWNVSIVCANFKKVQIQSSFLPHIYYWNYKNACHEQVELKMHQPQNI